MAQAWSAEDYYNQSLASLRNMIVYDWKTDLDEWLNNFPPSTILSANGDGCLHIKAESSRTSSDPDDESWESSTEEESECDEYDWKKRLFQYWEEVKQSEQQISFTTTTRELAIKYGVVAGSWLLAAKPGAEVDCLWRKVATAFVRNGFFQLAKFVRVTPWSKLPDSCQMIMIRDSDFTDEDTVFRLEKSLRMAGMRKPLKYKPDIHAYLKIYRVNEYGIRPSIFSSYYDPETHSYEIRCMYGPDVKVHFSRQLMPRASLWKVQYKKYIGQFSAGTDNNGGGDLDRWLDKYLPSWLDYGGWIVLEHEEDIGGGADLKNAKRKWQRLKMSKKPAIEELAKKCGVVSGTWLFHVETSHKVDYLWRKVATQFAHGVLKNVATRVQVSPLDSEVSVILVKHRDFTKEDEVHMLNDALRSVGVKSKLWYAPDIYAQLGIYEDNEYNISPILYVSLYDVLTHKNTCTRLHDTEENANNEEASIHL